MVFGQIQIAADSDQSPVPANPIPTKVRFGVSALDGHEI
jgi:hypothetical protein